jgi:hypothetical protein
MTLGLRWIGPDRIDPILSRNPSRETPSFRPTTNPPKNWSRDLEFPQNWWFVGKSKDGDESQHRR